MNTSKKSKNAKANSTQRPMIDEVFALAKQLGWTCLNDDERKLIETLRWTTYQGRAVVMEVAEGMRKVHPWIRGASDNTVISPELAEGRDYGMPSVGKPGDSNLVSHVGPAKRRELGAT